MDVAEAVGGFGGDAGYALAVENIASVNFNDLLGGYDATALVRAAHGEITLALTVHTRGDLEVVMTPEACAELTAALAQAQSRAEPS